MIDVQDNFNSKNKSKMNSGAQEDSSLEAVKENLLLIIKLFGQMDFRTIMFDIKTIKVVNNFGFAVFLFSCNLFR